MLNLDTKLKLDQAMIDAPNLATLFTKEEQDRIGSYIWDGYNQDKYSRNKWEKRTEAALNLALQVVEGKNFPWAGCANIAFPLVTIAALQFHSRAYPAIISSTSLVQYRVYGEDVNGEETARAERIGKHMSWQLLEESDSWEEQHDRLLVSVPIVGCAFKKTYYNQKNQSELVLAHDLVMDYYAKSVENCTRKTHIIPFYRNEIYTNVKLGIFTDILNDTWYTQHAIPLATVHSKKEDKRTGEAAPPSSEHTPFTMLEQHCWLDLDGDGYSEPYIATIEASSKKLVRLTSRIASLRSIEKTRNGEVISITAIEFFTKYGFIPSADGSVYDIGFGVLLGPLNETTNSLINQLLDAGTMATTAGGFLGKGAKFRGGAMTFSPLEWKRVDAQGDDLRKNIVPLPVREPSNVLFQLLSLIINYTGRVAGTTDTTVGENPGQNTPASSMQTMVEQGSKVYSAIFKRLWRSQKEEYKKWFLLNGVHLAAEQVYGGKGDSIRREDYLVDPSGVAPVADPHVTSDIMRIQQAITVADRARQIPGYNPEVTERQLLHALKVPNVANVYPGPSKVPQGKDPKMAIEELRAHIEMSKLEQQKMEFIASLHDQMQLTQAKILELTAKATLEMEQAGGVKTGHEIAQFDAAIGAMRTHYDILHKHVELMLQGRENGQDIGNNGGRLPPVAGTPSDQGGASDAAAESSIP